MIPDIASTPASFFISIPIAGPTRDITLHQAALPARIRATRPVAQRRYPGIRKCAEPNQPSSENPDRLRRIDRLSPAATVRLRVADRGAAGLCWRQSIPAVPYAFLRTLRGCRPAQIRLGQIKPLKNKAF